MKRVAGGLLVCSLLLGCGQQKGADGAPAADGTEPIGAQISEMARNVAMSGVVLITKDDEPLAAEAFNVESLRGDFSISVDSAFTIASITKSFTAVLVLQQVEQGRISLDASISAYLPEFDAAYANDVTVRQLLQNRSGIPHYVDIPGWFESETVRAFTAETFLDTIASLELRFVPGEDYYYSNANYYLLGLVLDEATAEGYESLLQRDILEPLALTNTGQIYEADAQAVAPTYLRVGDGYEQIELGNPALFRATASLYSTASDLLAFGRGLMTGAILGAEMREILLDPDRPMGFTISSVPLADAEVPVVTYNGELAGTTSMLTMFPEQDGAIVILANNNVPYSTLVDMTIAFAQTAFSELSISTAAE